MKKEMRQVTIFADSGLVEYYEDGKLHCIDGPAVIYPDGTEEYWHHGKLHRDGSPAIIHSDGRTYYYKEGIMVNVSLKNYSVFFK